MSAHDSQWRKSSHSSGGTGNCVEVALADDGAAIRDSKNAESARLDLDTAGWAVFLRSVKSGRYDH
jgi:Domain of unknown function (DUF397)